MTDYRTGNQGPAVSIFAITPDNDNALPVTPKWIRAVGVGQITLRAEDDEADIVHPVADGEVIFAIITHIRATGTDVDVIGYA